MGGGGVEVVGMVVVKSVIAVNAVGVVGSGGGEANGWRCCDGGGGVYGAQGGGREGFLYHRS